MMRRHQSCRASSAIRWVSAIGCVLLVCVVQSLNGSQSDRHQRRLDDAWRREGEALVRLADQVSRGEAVPVEFGLEWQNDFFKAQPGTFVPFTLTFSAEELRQGRALLYVRAERPGTRVTNDRQSASYAYETIFPVAVEHMGSSAVVRRGFAVPPGRYRLIVVLRELPPESGEGTDKPRRTAILSRDLQVPDFWTGELATSTVILADRLEPLSNPVPAGELDEHPYVVGNQRIHPAKSRVFRQNRELIVVFLVYNPMVGPNRHFDVQVDYHLYSKDRGEVSPAGRQGDHPPARPGERYVTRTNPQRFNPSLMGSRFDPASAPVLAGQGILLSSFEPGEYRLGITVTDLVARKSLTRDVTFTVVGS